MRDCYIPDLTERYPEGFNGVDMFEPYDPEAAAWEAMEREYKEEERREFERITEQMRREGYTIIKQGADGWTFAESGDTLILCTIKNGEVVNIFDSAKDLPENREYMLGLWQEINE